MAVQFLFGSLPVIAKPILAIVPAIPLVGIRVGLTAAVLVSFQLFRGRIWLEHREDYAKLAMLSVFGVTLNQLLFIGGLSYTRAANTSLLVATIPIFTLAVSALMGNERLRITKLAGIALAASGVIFLIDPRNASFSSETTIGDLMIIANSLSFGIYVATSKRIVMRNGAFRSMMWIFVFASIVCVPLGSLSISVDQVNAISTATWMLVLYLAVFATAVPYLLNAFALSRVSPSAVTVFIYLQPVIGFTLAAIFLGEMLDMRFLLAASLILSGVYLTVRRASGEPTEHMRNRQ